MSTKQHPGAHDCYAAALPDEPYFVLLARDPSAPELIEQWAAWRDGSVIAGTRPADEKAQVDEAYQCAADMRSWRRFNLGAWRKLRPAEVSHSVHVKAQKAHDYLASELKRHAPAISPGAGLLEICAQTAGFITALVNQNKAMGDMIQALRQERQANAERQTANAFAFENQFTNAGAPAPETPERTTPKVSATVGAPPRPNLAPGPWLHYRFGIIFELLHVALNEGTGEWMVVHMNRHSRTIFVRPASEWEQIVVTPDGRRLPRFRAPERKERKII